MEPPKTSFTVEVNVRRQVALLVFDELRAMISLSFQFRRLEAFRKARLFTFPGACFEFEDVGREAAQHSSLANFPEIPASHAMSV